MEKRTIAIIIGSVLCISAVSFLVWCTVLFWQNKDKQDLSYDNGYTAGAESLADELAEQLDELEQQANELGSLNALIIEYENNLANANAFIDDFLNDETV